MTDSLKPFSVEIIQRVDPNEILSHLLSRGLLTDTQMDTLSSTNNLNFSEKKNYLLCNVLLKLSEDNVDKFLECLKDTSGYGPHDELLKTINKGMC